MKGPPGRQGDLEFFAHQACPVQGAERGGAVPAKTEATSRCPGGSVSVKQVLFPADQSALNVNRKPTRRDVLVRPPRHTVVHLDGYVSLPGAPPQAGAHATSGTHLPGQWLQVAAGDLSRPASGQGRVLCGQVSCRTSPAWCVLRPRHSGCFPMTSGSALALGIGWPGRCVRSLLLPSGF